MEKKLKTDFSNFCKNFADKAKQTRTLEERKTYVNSYSDCIKKEIKQCVISDREHLFQSFSL